jgi:hypothetical protein
MRQEFVSRERKRPRPKMSKSTLLSSLRVPSAKRRHPKKLLRNEPS